MLTNVIDFISRLNKSGNNSTLEGDIVFGLPLEANGRKVYPVYRESGSANGSGNPEQHPVGYLEVEGSRADFTRLEPDYRWVAVLTAVVLVVIGLLGIRRLR